MPLVMNVLLVPPWIFWSCASCLFVLKVFFVLVLLFIPPWRTLSWFSCSFFFEVGLAHSSLKFLVLILLFVPPWSSWYYSSYWFLLEVPCFNLLVHSSLKFLVMVFLLILPWSLSCLFFLEALNPFTIQFLKLLVLLSFDFSSSQYCFNSTFQAFNLVAVIWLFKLLILF